MNINFPQKNQKGQAMVFGLLFLAVAIMTLLILYNQGQLVKNRVQLENAADAAVYSQAKLSARNQNFIAYTNRAMVANEVSIGQMVALLSWAKHYKQVNSFTSFPLYTIPIAPPSPTTMQSILNVVLIPWKAMGTAVEVPTKKLVEVWPPLMSYMNGALGIFQKVFILSTIEAQVEMNIEVVKDHEFDPDNPEMFTPVVGWYFFTQNILMTYFGENFSPDNLYAAMVPADTDNANAHELMEAFLGEFYGIDNMINANSPSTSNSNSSTGKDANLNASEDDDSAVEAYQRFAAIVNRNREAFTEDRHWDVGTTVDIPRINLTIPTGIVNVIISLKLDFWTGIKSDGGTAYLASNDFEKNDDIEGLGWASIDVASMGIEIDIALGVDVQICLFGCTTYDLFDLDIKIPIGLPLAGATHQLVSNTADAKKVITDWGFPGFVDAGIYGGNDDEPLNGGAFDLFHLAALGWGQLSPTLAPGMYGARTAVDVTDTYGGAAPFHSLGESFQESAVSYEFTVALTKSLDDVETTDSSTFDIKTGEETDWDSDDIAYTRFDVTTRSRAEGTDLISDYQQVAWMDSRPMMTVSSAETYFVNPMQENSDGSSEPASLFSPFWDARLKEPSAIAIMIATGEIDWTVIIDGLNDNEAIDMVEWLLDTLADKLIESVVEYATEKVDAPPPIDGYVEDALNDSAEQVKDVAIGATIDKLEDYMP